MSWLFGRRKHQKDSPPDSPPDEEEQPNQDDRFIIVERRQAPPPPVDGGGAPYPTGGLYPSLSGGNTYPPNNPQATSGDPTTHGDAASYLSGVPFKLCKQLERNMNDDTEIDSLRVGEIELFLGRMEQRNYEYSFSLEQGIVDEMIPPSEDE